MSTHTVAAYRHDLLKALAGILRAAARYRALVGAEQFSGARLCRGRACRRHRAAQHSAALVGVRSFYEYLMREGHAKHNPALDVRAPKSKKRLPATLDADQMARLLDFRADDSLSARDKAMMELFYSSGLRLSEFVGLDLSAVDLKDRTVRVLGKGNKTRIVPIGRHAIEALKRWLAERAALVRRTERRRPPHSGAVFVGKIGPAFVGASGAVARGRCGRAARVLSMHVHPAYVSPLLCHPSAGIQRRFARRAGACWATPTSAPPRFTRIWIFSIWPAFTMPPIREPGAGLARLERAQVRPHGT